MPGVAELIQMITGLRQLQLQASAQELQRQQLGVTAQAGFRNTLEGLQDPTSLLSSIPEYTQSTGLSPQTLQTLIRQTPPAAATTVAGAVQRGAQQAGGGYDQPAAARALTGALPGGIEEDKTMKYIFGGAQNYLQELPEPRRAKLISQFANRLTTGQDIGASALSVATADFIENAPPELRDQIVAVGRGLAPSASEKDQAEIGWAKYRLDQRNSEAGLALEDLKFKASKEIAARTLDAQAFKELDDLIARRSEFLTTAERTSATMTKEGRASFADQINVLNEQIRRIAPNIYGKNAPYEVRDFPKGGTVGATGITDYLKFLAR